MGAVFVTGTDTGVGKTFVACALAIALRRRGRRVAVLKPVETGVDDEPDDARRLRDAADDSASLDVVCPYRLRAPLAPAVAAAREGVTIDVAAIVERIARRRTEADDLIVEGAGGLLVPLAGTTTFLDVARAAALPLLVVGANRLGTINHCALTVHVARSAGVPVNAFVLSQPMPVTDVSAEDNADVVSKLVGIRCAGVLAHLAAPDAAAGLLDVALAMSNPARAGVTRPPARNFV